MGLLDWLLGKANLPILRKKKFRCRGAVIEANIVKDPYGAHPVYFEQNKGKYEIYINEKIDKEFTHDEKCGCLLHEVGHIELRRRYHANLIIAIITTLMISLAILIFFWGGDRCLAIQAVIASACILIFSFWFTEIYSDLYATNKLGKKSYLAALRRVNRVFPRVGITSKVVDGLITHPWITWRYWFIENSDRFIGIKNRVKLLKKKQLD